MKEHFFKIFSAFISNGLSQKLQHKNEKLMKWLQSLIKARLSFIIKYQPHNHIYIVFLVYNLFLLFYLTLILNFIISVIDDIIFNYKIIKTKHILFWRKRLF